MNGVAELLPLGGAGLPALPLHAHVTLTRITSRNSLRFMGDPRARPNRPINRLLNGRIVLQVMSYRAATGTPYGLLSGFPSCPCTPHSFPLPLLLVPRTRMC